LKQADHRASKITSAPTVSALIVAEFGIALNENGIGHKAVGWQGKTQLFEKCEVCDGTGLQSSRAPGNG
jgi:hypothetical protein